MLVTELRGVLLCRFMKRSLSLQPRPSAKQPTEFVTSLLLLLVHLQDLCRCVSVGTGETWAQGSL